ncbi:hypothetical protein THTE_3798 [Thermogutta terrifontis]|uniref:Uncharacterized protein n=1 Tax=Thermogutta terrifontis TaxID=1331910 RepID=A0A286RKA7_9BACT|nr:hypothetical protein THTE_3798 [Thermogutta terrifontis]
MVFAGYSVAPLPPVLRETVFGLPAMTTGQAGLRLTDAHQQPL